MAKSKRKPDEGGADSGVSGATLQGFASVADSVGATTKKLEKAALLGAYFGGLADEDLALAARYFAGHVFPLYDARTTNVGGGMLRDAVSEVTGLEVENLRPRYVRLGDSGDVAFEAFAETKGASAFAPTHTLGATQALIERLSETRGTKNKKALLVNALAPATPPEAKYLVKLLVGDLRIGLKEGLVEDAVARAFGRPLADVARSKASRCACSTPSSSCSPQPPSRPRTWRARCPQSFTSKTSSTASAGRRTCRRAASRSTRARSTR